MRADRCGFALLGCNDRKINGLLKYFALSAISAYGHKHAIVSFAVPTLSGSGLPKMRV